MLLYTIKYDVIQFKLNFGVICFHKISGTFPRDFFPIESIYNWISTYIVAQKQIIKLFLFISNVVNHTKSNLRQNSYFFKIRFFFTLHCSCKLCL